ncbi:MAG: aminodeoxychorismate synthase component I, partial [Candidatus Omnitrophica bacterium]|nr:aminodeoxychorismate synthase component I [Candidatus Omnitrophota bacterium]
YKVKKDAFELFKNLKSMRGNFLLDSSLNADASLGRYSIIGCQPYRVLKGSELGLLDEIRLELDKNKVRQNALPFCGGAVGYLAYDSGNNVPAVYFAFYNSAIILDHVRQQLHLYSSGIPEKSGSLAKKLAEENFKRLAGICSMAESKKNTIRRFVNKKIELRSNFSKEEYLRAVKKAKEYIRKGDIYQINLSQQFSGKTDLLALEIYHRLRKESPSYFSAFFDCGNFQIISSSPERFLKVDKGQVSTRPMKGTRPRCLDPDRDRKLRQELLKSEKDKAELLMIVDLERNDLGRVCDYNSIKVSNLRQLEEYSTVFQVTATVEGRLHKSFDRIDLIRVSFPGGSITGCPKLRSIEIIKELEKTRRGIYTGCLGFLSFCGKMDMNILIRTILKKGKQVYFGCGGGIVADSQPQAEYDETLVKAKAIVSSLGGAL